MTDSEDKLLRVAKSDTNNAARRSAIVHLRDMGSEQLRPILLEILKKEQNENLRETAIKALGEVGLKDDIQLVREIADGETGVRAVWKECRTERLCTLGLSFWAPNVG